jgi:hypothetical protein
MSGFEKQLIMDKFKIINELINHPGYISNLELAWLKTIKRPTGHHSKETITREQLRALMTIYKKYIKEKELVEKYGDFYRDLESGKRPPKTEDQKHFVLVCKGIEKPRTVHEVSYLKSKSVFYTYQVIDFRINDPFPVEVNKPNVKSTKTTVKKTQRRKVACNPWLGLKRYKGNWW